MNSLEGQDAHSERRQRVDGRPTVGARAFWPAAGAAGQQDGPAVRPGPFDAAQRRPERSPASGLRRVSGGFAPSGPEGPRTGSGPEGPRTDSAPGPFDAAQRRPAAATADDDFPILGFDHLELYVGNAKQSAAYYCHAFGFQCTGVRGLATGERERASYLVEQGDIRLVLTSGLHSGHPAALSVRRHGDSVAVIALSVPSADEAFAAAVERGADAAAPPATASDGHGELRHAAIRLYGDCVLQFMERRNYAGVFGPGFERVPQVPGAAKPETCGLLAIDHVVANVELGRMNEWARFFSRVLGFSQLVHFDDEAISTEYSALMSKVMQDGSGAIKFPINEPAEGRKKSQIEEFLDFHEGPGVQHIACRTDDIVTTVSRLRQNGVEFLHVPRAYYDDLEERVGTIDEPIDRLAELGILADRDEDGYLLQIFTKPVEDRPTLFYEIIERHGARGFGEGNFKSLFVALEREQELRGNL